MHKEIPAEFCYPSSLHALFSLAMSAISYFRYLAVYPFFLPRLSASPAGLRLCISPFYLRFFHMLFCSYEREHSGFPFFGASECSSSFYLSLSQLFQELLSTSLLCHFIVDNFCHFGGICTNLITLKNYADKSAAAFIYYSFHSLTQLSPGVIGHPAKLIV